MMRGIMAHIRNLPEKPLKGTCETDEAYVKAGSNGVELDTNGEDRIVPSRRGLLHGPDRSTFEKNRPIVAIHFRRATEYEPDHTIMDVPRDGKTLADMVQERRARLHGDDRRAHRIQEPQGGGTTTTPYATVRASTPPASATKSIPTTASAG